MKSKIQKPVKKYVFSKIMAQLSEVENVVERTAKDATDTKLTFLVKMGKYYLGDDREAKEQSGQFKAYWKKLLGPKTDFGFFYNSEIGTIFIAGPLSEIFLHDLDGKKLAELSGGPYGILRGLGIAETEAATDIKKLNEGLYLLLTRANDTDLNFLEDTIERLEKAG